MSERCELLHYEGGCQWCGKPLPPRHTRWCSRKCTRAHTANHRWTNARSAARRRAVVHLPRSAGPTTQPSVPATQRKALYRCARCGGAFENIEVNHIIPCKGKHSQWGCWHHQDNLECLCHDCHVATTAEQRRNGLLGKPSEPSERSEQGLI